eukprot:1134154-Pyramimonas_sp.AAC.1
MACLGGSRPPPFYHEIWSTQGHCFCDRQGRELLLESLPAAAPATRCALHAGPARRFASQRERPGKRPGALPLGAGDEAGRSTVGPTWRRATRWADAPG